MRTFFVTVFLLITHLWFAISPAQSADERAKAEDEETQSYIRANEAQIRQSESSIALNEKTGRFLTLAPYLIIGVVAIIAAIQFYVVTSVVRKQNAVMQESIEQGRESLALSQEGMKISHEQTELLRQIHETLTKEKS